MMWQKYINLDPVCIKYFTKLINNFITLSFFFINGILNEMKSFDKLIKILFFYSISVSDSQNMIDSK